MAYKMPDISFLPTLNGKQLILVEDLIEEDNKLLPVQEGTVKFHGSTMWILYS
jgi:Xanthine dehydrogenase, iron-sulfur cluster and FAD-binding subunit A